MIYSIITGTGSYIPTRSIKNEDFLNHEFYENYDKKLDKPNQEVIDKFVEITTIAERRHVTDDLVTSDIAFLAAEEAIKNAGIDKEDLDYIIFAHNFGDVQFDNRRTDIVPTLAARVKHKLVLSRISDPHDRDSMLYADGAGAVILEAKESDTPIGILAHSTRSDTFAFSEMLHMGKSFKQDEVTGDNLYLKMNGRRLYQYALETVPQAIKTCMDKSGTHIEDISKVLIHQANGKMDDAILKRLYALYNITEMPHNVMPMSISWLGNSSVATLPTLLDLILKDNLKTHSIIEGDILVFASVGAGMNINALVYKM